MGGPREPDLLTAMTGRLVAASAALLFAALAVIAAETTAPRGEVDAVAAAIQALVERAAGGEALAIEGSAIASQILLPHFYERRHFAAAWSDPTDVDALLEAIRGSESHGLDPADYHLAALESLRPRAAGDPERTAGFDLLSTDALFRLAYHLEFGKVDAKSFDADWNFVHPFPEDPIAALQGALEAHRVREAVDERAPQTWIYERMRSSLAELRRIAAAGGFPRVPDGPMLRGGDSGPPVAAVRARLAAEGALAPSEGAADEAFDERLGEALRRFQARNGLDADGTVGARTLAELNVAAAARVDQLRVNLERARWVLHDLPTRFVFVNVPSFEVFYFDDRKVVWRARAQVGREGRRTPIFRAEMKYLVVNPTWTVPSGILAKDILSSGANAGSVVKRKGLRVLDASGREVDPDSVSWGRYSARNFPYQLRQDPGPKNALGRIKFMFPNPYQVYLHDTPSIDKFEASDRALSSGCIRVEDPFGLADALLRGSDGWTRERLDAVVSSEETTTVWLPEPVPVLLLYWTALPTPEGEMRWFRDLYQRDPKVLAGLARPFEFRRADREAARTRLE
jgi:murein L,D-transpeptidase YcbB/YkuD